MKLKNYLETIDGVGIYPLITLLMFFTFFTVLVLFVFRMQKEQLESMNRLPLGEDESQSPING